MRLISRSYRETRGRCKRKSYYLYLYRTHGYDSVVPNVDLAIGICVHAGLEFLLKNRTGGDIRSIILMAAGMAKEMCKTLLSRLTPLEREAHEALVWGLVYAWGTTKYPSFIEKYEILSVELELPPMVLAPGLGLQVRTDATVRDKETGEVIVINWKTSGEKEGFTSKWGEEVQGWTEAMATEQHLGIRVSGVQYHGFFKGVKRDGIFMSPLAWGYRRKLSTGEQLYSPKWASGWQKFPVWKEFEGGQAAWIDWLPPQLVEEMFPVSPPVLKNDSVVEKWLRQLVRYERDAQHILDNGTEAEAEDFFEQEFSNHNCRGCPFKDVCFDRASIDDLVELGRLEKRHDHHSSAPAEVEAHAAADAQ